MPQSPPPSSSNSADPAADFQTVGTATARAIHGHSAGADVVVLGSGSNRGDRLTGVLAEVCTPTSLTAVDQVGAGALRRLAEAADTGDGPLVVADIGLAIELPAVLDLLDVPGDRTAALLADPRNIEAPRQVWSGIDRATVARTGPDGVIESSAAVGYSVGDPNRLLVGLLRIAARDRAMVAATWRAAADELTSGGVGPRPSAGDEAELGQQGTFDLALLALVRSGLPVAGSQIGYFDWSRHGFGAAGIGRSPWRQRLRSASRLGDGAYSTAVVRPVSRLGSRLALAINLTPNVITVISIVIGIGAAVLIMTGDPVGWIVAAVLIQLALVIDCMDGEVARFTRRFSTVGAWLDGIGDRLKEYLIFAAVAAVAARDGSSISWLLAVVAMVLITARHLEDYAYSDRSAGARVSVLQSRSLAEAEDGRTTDRTTLPPQPSTRQQLVFWLKKIIHAPVAERTLIISLGLLTLQPLVVLVASIVVSLVALAWTFGGRLLRAFRSSRPYGGTELDQQLDLGSLGVRLARPLLARAAAATPGRLDWLALPMVFVVEAAVITTAGWTTLSPGWGWLVYLAVAAVVYRRYELIYGIRLFSAEGPRPTLGADGRILLTLLAWLVAALTEPAALRFGLIALTVIVAVEGALGTAARRNAAGNRPG